MIGRHRSVGFRFTSAGHRYDDAVDSEKSVFVDASGRRRRMARTAGLLLGALLIGYAVMLGISLGTGASVPMTTWVAPDKHKPVRADVDADTGLQQKSPVVRNGSTNVVVPGAPRTTPRPSTSVSVNPSASATPGVTVTS